MPLMNSRSKKAFSKNVETEMKHGKPQPQALAIAYSVKRRAKKASGGAVESGSKDMNMAEGGQISISAKDEKRPMPDNTYGDSDQARRNKGNKASSQDSWTSNPTIKQAQKPSITKLSQPKIMGSDAFSVRNRDMRDDENDLMDRTPPQTDRAQPIARDDEMDAKKMGKGPDMAKPHTSARAYTKASEDDDTEDRAEPDMKKVQSYAKGGHVNSDLEDSDHDAEMHNSPMDDEYGDGAEEDQEPMMSPLDGLDDEETPAVDEFMSSNRMAPMLAKGGHIDEMEDNYADDGDSDSIAAAIMARRDRLHDEIDSGAHDLDAAARYARGGEILSHDSIYPDDSDEADLSRNHDEDANEEDQLSFNSLMKENYNDSNLDEDQPMGSNLKGDDREDETHDKHDRVSAIRARMKSKRQF